MAVERTVEAGRSARKRPAVRRWMFIAIEDDRTSLITKGFSNVRRPVDG